MKHDRIRYDEDGTSTLLCCQCDQPATCFAPPPLGTLAYCDACAPVERMSIRAEPTALCSCVCGETLDIATSKGVWTMGGIAAEYRDCLNCGSTRAYMPRDEIPGRPVLYSFRGIPFADEKWPSLLAAVDRQPTEAGAELVRAGVPLARAFEAADGGLYWRILAPTNESG